MSKNKYYLGTSKEWTKKVVIHLIIGAVLLAIGAALLAIGISRIAYEVSSPNGIGHNEEATSSQIYSTLIPLIVLVVAGAPLTIVGGIKTFRNTGRLISIIYTKKWNEAYDIEREKVNKYLEETKLDSISGFIGDNSITVVPNNEPVDNSIKNTASSTVFNIFWIIFVGIWSVISNFCLGVALCCTIIGIPAGISCFKMIPLVFRPAGREVRLHYGAHKFWNSVNLIFGGLENYLIYTFAGIILCITIIGIPLGRQYFKIAKFYLAPYGSETIIATAYSKNRNHYRDTRLFFEHLCQENRPVKLSNGATVSAVDAAKVALAGTNSGLIGYNCYHGQRTLVESIALDFVIDIFIVIGILLEAIIISVATGTPFTELLTSDSSSVFIFTIIFAAIFAGVTFVFTLFSTILTHRFKKADLKIFEEKLKNISTYYPRQVRTVAKEKNDPNQKTTLFYRLNRQKIRLQCIMREIH